MVTIDHIMRMNMSIDDKKISRSKQQAEVLLSREDFQNDLIDLHGRLPMPLPDLDQGIYLLIKKYKLAPSWTLGLRSYAETLDPEKLFRFEPLIMATRRNRKTGIEELWIKIESDTTLNDIKKRWSFIMRRQKLLEYSGKRKFQPIDKAILDRNKFVYDLKHNGKSLQEIADELNKKYPDETFIYSDIPTMIRNYKRQTGVN